MLFVYGEFNLFDTHNIQIAVMNESYCCSLIVAVTG